jgi:glycosyltransferase involved in cell wall biosynthesis
MTIAMLVINPFIHDTRVQKEAKALAHAGYDVTVYALHKPGLPRTETRDGYDVVRITIRPHQWRVNSLRLLVKYLEFCLRAIHQIQQQHPAIIHAHDVNALIPAFLAARRTHASLIYDAHELWAERRATLLQSAALRRFLRWIEGTLARRAAAVITVNPSIAELLQQQYQLPTCPTVLMHCQEFAIPARNDILRREFDIPPDQRIVIYPGLFVQGRGLEHLIAAAPYLDRAVIVLMGRNQLGNKLQTQIANLGLEQHVFIRLPVPPEEVLHYVASADIGVMPTQSIDLSYHYGAGNKLFHYMMAGIPAAVSDQPEKRRIVETYQIGAVFDQTDPQDIARVINQLLNDTETYTAMSQRARELARDQFNWQLESQKLLRLYQRLTGTRNQEASHA